MQDALPDRAAFDPDGQPPMPFPAADDYARRVMGWAREPLPAGVVAMRDIAYGAHRLQRYNVFAPEGARDAPVLVFWHGGGWTNGYRDYVSFMAPHVVRLGLVLVAPSYRLVADARLPAAFDDCCALLRHFASNNSAHGGAADRLYLAGHSAGGHLAALTTLRSADALGPALPAGAVRACLPISGIMDLHHPAPSPGSLEERVYTAVLRDADDDAAMSPICWTAGNTVPFMLLHGEHDSPRVMRSNRRMLALMRLQKAPAELRVEAGADHFTTHTMLADGTHPWYARLAQLVRDD